MKPTDRSDPEVASDDEPARIDPLRLSLLEVLPYLPLDQINAALTEGRIQPSPAVSAHKKGSR